MKNIKEIFFIFGIICGIITGIIPGLHPNFITTLALTQDFNHDEKTIFIVAMYASYLIFSLIPSIFFSVAKENTVGALLAGQKMLLEGKGIYALKIGIVSILIGAVGSLLIYENILVFYRVGYEAIKPYLFLIISFFAILFILRSISPIKTLFIFVLSGLIGIINFSLEMEDEFLPLFTGFFAVAAMLQYKNESLPRQSDSKLNLSIFLPAIIGVFLGLFANLFPAINTPAQIAAFFLVFIPYSTEKYLALVTSISASQFIFSFASYEAIEKPRNGVVASLSEQIDISGRIYEIMVYFLMALILSSYFLYRIRKKIEKITQIDLTNFFNLLIIYLFLIILIIDGIYGIIIFSLASGVSFLCMNLRVERIAMMGSLIIPTLILLI